MSKARRILEKIDKKEQRRMKKMLKDLSNMLQVLAGEMSPEEVVMIQQEIDDLNQTMVKAAA